jgi:hypothetical protein
LRLPLKIADQIDIVSVLKMNPLGDVDRLERLVAPDWTATIPRRFVPLQSSNAPVNPAIEPRYLQHYT